MFFKILKIIPYIIIAFLLLRITNLNKQNEKLRGKTAELSEQLKSQTIITKEKIVYKYRDSEGKPKQQEYYFPSEGSIEIITPKENEDIKPTIIDNFFNTIVEQTDGSLIKIQNKGLCFAPLGSFFYSKELEFSLQLRLLYWNRYSFGFGYSDKETLFIFSDRHLSDILPFLKNTSIQVIYGKNLNLNENRVGVGLNVRL